MTFIPFLPPGITQAYADTLYAALSHTHAASAIVSGVLDNARVNWAAPDAIGGTTPAAGTFTQVTVNSSIWDTAGQLHVGGLPGGAFDDYDLTVIGATGGIYLRRDNISSLEPFIHLATQTGDSGGQIRGKDGGGLRFTSASNTAYFETKSAVGTGNVRILAVNASHFGLAIKLAADHTANALEVWNSSNAVLAAINNIGGAVFKPTDAATNTATTVITAGHNSSGNPAAGFAGDIAFTLKSSTTNDRKSSVIRSEWNDPNNLAAIADLILAACHNANGTVTEREGFRVRGGASATAISFYGVTPTARQVLATGAGASVDDVITALQTLGLVRQS